MLSWSHPQLDVQARSRPSARLRFTEPMGFNLLEAASWIPRRYRTMQRPCCPYSFQTGPAGTVCPSEV